MNLKIIDMIFFFGACLFICIPSFTQPIDLEGMDAEALHAIKQGLDEATLTEDGMYKVSIPENHLAMLASVGAATAGALVPLRNWQEYLLDTDGRYLDEKLRYLFEHQDEFGLDMRYFEYRRNISGPNRAYFHVHRYHTSSTTLEILTKEYMTGDYEIVLDPIYSGNQRLSFITDGDYNASISAISIERKRKMGYRVMNVERGVYNLEFLTRGNIYTRRRRLIEMIASHTVQPHVALPGSFVRNARGAIVRNTSLSKRLLRRLPVVGTVGAIGVGLYSLFFANDAEADTREDVFENILMTPEDFQQANEAVDLALDSYYSTQ